MGFISPGGENLLDFLKLRQVLSTYDGDLRDPLWWPQERPGSLRVAPGPFGIPLPSMTGPKIFVESVPEPEDSSLVLTWSWGTSGVSPGESVLVSSGGMHVRFPPALGAVSHFPLRGSRDLWLFLEAFPRGFPTRLSHKAAHVPPWCESIVGLKVEAVQGKQVSLEWTETSAGIWEWWQDPGVPLAFPVESASS